MILEDFFKRIETQYEEQLPFVIYRKPNKLEVKGLLQNSNDLFFTSSFKEQGFVFAPFDDRADTVLMPLERSEQLVTRVTIGESRMSQYKDQLSQNAKKQHTDLVEKAIKAIKSSNFKKVVLSRKETVNLQEASLIDIFKRLANTYPAAFVYCWYHPKVGLWLGATPETLVKIEGHRFSIMALAGTQVYNGTLDVKWDDKEIQEQRFVTDFVLESLKPSAESIKVSDTNTVKAGNLLHLKTMISAQLKAKSNLKEVLSAIHPTPAVCGYPKNPAKDFILENENYNRAFYTGFLGELNFETTSSPRSGKRNIENRAYAITKKSTQLYVNLRCMQLTGDEATIYIGGGITESSNPEKEWEETVAKSMIIKSIL